MFSQQCNSGYYFMYFTKLSCISISGDEKGCKVLGRVVLLHKGLRGQRGDNA